MFGKQASEARGRGPWPARRGEPHVGAADKPVTDVPRARLNFLAPQGFRTPFAHTVSSSPLTTRPTALPFARVNSKTISGFSTS